MLHSHARVRWIQCTYNIWDITDLLDVFDIGNVWYIWWFSLFGYFTYTIIYDWYFFILDILDNTIFWIFWMLGGLRSLSWTYWKWCTFNIFLLLLENCKCVNHFYKYMLQAHVLSSLSPKCTAKWDDIILFQILNCSLMSYFCQVSNRC